MPPEIRPEDLASTSGSSGVAQSKASIALRAGSEKTPPEKVAHPIHTAGLYFACHDPEAQWIADMEAEAENG